MNSLIRREDMLSDKEISRSHRSILLCQCTGLLTYQFLYNGFILNYVKNFGVNDSKTFIILTFIPNLYVMLLTLPLAHLSDKKGMKKIGITGNWLKAIGFGMFAGAFFFSNSAAFYIFLLASIVYSLGYSLFASNWFALIDPLIEPSKRGSFFAKLRISWQIVGFICTLLVSALIKIDDSLNMYVYIIVFIMLMAMVRIYYYSQIPEVHQPNHGIGNMRQTWQKLKKNKAYMKFCWYYFCIAFLIFGFFPFTNLFEKGSLGFTGLQIITMGYILQAGFLIGYWAGAHVVDRIGNEPLFTVSNILLLLVAFLFIFIQFLPFPLLVTAGVLTFVFGMVFSAHGISVTAETLKRVEPGEKSFGIGVCSTMAAAGGAASSLVSSVFLKYCSELQLNVGSYQLNHYEIFLGFIAFGLLLVNIFFRFKKEAELE